MSRQKAALVKGDVEPTIYDTLLSIVSEIIRGAAMRNHSCMPGIVEQYDRERHMVAVRPLVNRVSYDGEDHEREVLWVTLHRFQVGGFLIDLPVFVGDVGWLIGCDRDAQAAKMANSKIQEKDTCKMKDGEMDYGRGNQGPQAPSVYDFHSFNSGFFIPDSWATIKIPEKYRDSLLIQNVDAKGDASGRIYITREGRVGIESSDGLDVNADVKSSGTVTHEGDIEVSGDILLGARRISLSASEIPGKHEAKFRAMRFATTTRDGKLVWQTAYVLSTDAVADGKQNLAAPNNNIVVEGGGESVEYVLESGGSSNLKFSVDGAAETSSVSVNQDLAGKTVGINVYYV